MNTMPTSHDQFRSGNSTRANAQHANFADIINRNSQNNPINDPRIIDDVTRILREKCLELHINLEKTGMTNHRINNRIAREWRELRSRFQERGITLPERIPEMDIRGEWINNPCLRTTACITAILSSLFSFILLVTFMVISTSRMEDSDPGAAKSFFAALAFLASCIVTLRAAYRLKWMECC